MGDPVAGVDERHDVLEKRSQRPGRPRKTAAGATAGAAKTENGLVSSLSKALRILTLFSADRPDWSPAEIAAATGMHRASVYRILRTMENEAFVAVDSANGRYHLGAAMHTAAYLTQTDSELVRVAHPHLQALAEHTNETANLAIDVDGWPVVVDQVLTSHIYKPVLPFGKAMVDLQSSHAKLFLAFKPEREQRARVAADERSAAAGAGAVEQLLRELKAIRAGEVSYDIGSMPGVCAISVPVYDHSGVLRASMAVVAPPERFGAEQMAACVALARAEAGGLSRDLGYQREQAD
jgi:IclR family transcriptional regulator, KDG regulon repressor